MDLKGSKTEENLKSSLIGESMARNKYTFYASQARSDGYEELSMLFERMAQNESTHARVWFDLLNKSISNNGQNILEAAASENKEWISMYPEFAKIAREEGFEDIAQTFDMIAKIEKDHEHQFLTSYIRFKTNKMDSLEEPDAQNPSKITGYRCIFCGATYEDKPDVCRVCHSIGSFEECLMEE